MDWEKALPVVNGTVGGFFMAVAIWAIVTNKIALPREVQVYKTLYEKSEADKAKVEAQNDELVADLRRSHDTMGDTAKALQNANNLLSELMYKGESAKT